MLGYAAMSANVFGLGEGGVRKYQSSNLVQKLIESTNV
jgi:predicted regulator of Ras-like GTPase activity (Roadblock/LC7/MglB family)